MPAAELPKLMLWQVVFKTLYEVIALPVTIRIVRSLKAHEGESSDRGVSYNIFKIFEIQG